MNNIDPLIDLRQMCLEKAFVLYPEGPEDKILKAASAFLSFVISEKPQKVLEKTVQKETRPLEGGIIYTNKGHCPLEENNPEIDKGLTFAQRSVLDAVCALADKGHDVYPARVAEELGTDIANISRIFPVLESKGYLSIHQPSGRGRKFFVPLERSNGRGYIKGDVK